MSLLKELIDSIPVNIEAIIKSAGIKLNKNAKPEEIAIGVNRSSGEKFIGEIRKEGEEYRILVLGSDHYYRKRFTMAHELGHYILHKEKIDKNGSIADSLSSETSCGITPEEETEANNYAAQILMPEDKVREIFAETLTNLANEDNKEEKAIDEMYKIFQVSRTPMKIRLSSLGLISE